MKKSFTKKLVSIILSSLMCIPLIACTNGSSQADYAYMAIDINPTLEFVLKNGVVESVSAVNDDGAILISSENLVGKTVEQATKIVVEVAEDLGYLNTSNDGVKITIASENEAHGEHLLERAFNGARNGSVIAKVNSNPRSADGRKVEELKEENIELFNDITPEKVRLIEAIMKYDSTFTFEQGAEISLSDLVELLHDYIEEYKELSGEELKQEFKSKIEVLKRENERAIAQILGEEYLTLFDSYHELKGAYMQIKRIAEQQPISQEDINTIMLMLNIEDINLISHEGIVTVESVDHFVDRKNIEDAEELIENVLDKYDEEHYILTEADVTAIKTAYGEEIAINVGDTLEAVEDILEQLEENLSELKEELYEALTPEKKDAIRQLLEQTKNHGREAYEQMADKINQMKNRFHGLKEELKQRIA